MLIIAALLFFWSRPWARRSRRPAPQFIIFRIIGGLGIGAASITSPMYIAEISPARIRGRMVSVNQFAIVSGMLIVYFVNYFIADYGKRADHQLATEIGAKQGYALNVEKVVAQIDRLVFVKSPDDREKAAAIRERHSRGASMISKAT